MIRILLIATVLLEFSVGVAYSAINTAHPRIWLDTAKVSSLKALVSTTDGGTAGSSSAEWVALKAFCDAHVAGTSSSGYRGEDWYAIIVSLSLAYRVTGDEAYAQGAVKYLDAMLFDKLSIGDGQGHVKSADGYYKIGGDSNGWTARTFGSGIAIARDWLDGSPSLTQARVSNVALRLSEWFDYYTKDSSAYQGPSHPDGESWSDNFWVGNFTMLYLAELSGYGDTNYNTNISAKVAEMWGHVSSLINKELDGGDWTEGWSYGAWSSRELIQYLGATSTGTDKNLWSTTNWYDDLVKSHIFMLYPERTFFSDDGSQSGTVYASVNTSTMLYLAGLQNVSAENRGFAKWYTDNTTLNGYQWENFLWGNVGVSSIAPTIGNIGNMYNMGNHHVIFRGADWSDTKGTLVEFLAKSAENTTVGQGDRNTGMIKIGGQGEELLIDGDTTGFESTWENVPLVTGSHTYAPGQEWWHFVSIEASSGAGIGYATTRKGETAYDGKDDRYTPWPLIDPSLSFYEREVSFFPPNYVIVYDNIQAVDTGNDVSFRWHFAENPTVSGNVVTGTVNTARLFLTELGIPGSFTAPVLNQQGVTREHFAYAVDWETTGTPLNSQAIHLFEVATTAKSIPSVSNLITGSGVTGAEVDNNIAIFNTSTTGIPSSAITYAFNGGNQTKHIVSGLTTGAKFSVVSTGTTTKTISITADNAGDVTSNNIGVVSFTVETNNTVTQILMSDSSILDTNITCYPDVDNDLYPGTGSESVQTCSANHYIASHFTAMTIDCNDTDAAINPGATEICGDGIDQDCVGGDLACGGGGHASISTTGNMSFTAGGHLSIQ